MSDNFDNSETPTGDVVIIVAKAALFSAGQLHITTGAQDALRRANTSFAALLKRHLYGDWGDLDKDDKKMNDAAVKSGEDRVFSAYKLPQTHQTVWVIIDPPLKL